LLANEDEYNRQ